MTPLPFFAQIGMLRKPICNIPFVYRHQGFQKENAQP